jgi:GMP synthase-like glutamine amidotransferase
MRSIILCIILFGIGKAVSAWILKNSASILEREPWVNEEIGLVRKAADNGLSLLGSCYGHQLIVLALAGFRHVQRSPHPEVGWIPIQINRQNGFLGKSGRAYAFSSHFDEVIDLPENYRVLASSKNCAVQAFWIKDRPIWGLQIHPEINISEARRFLRNLVKRNRAPLQLFKQALNSEPQDSGLIRYVADNFFDPSR